MPRHDQHSAQHQLPFNSSAVRPIKKRSEYHPAPCDIQRRATSGDEPLVGVFDTIDETEAARDDDSAESGAAPLFINLVNQVSLASNAFSFDMSRGGGSGSEICFRCTNSAKYTGSIIYYPLDSSATSGAQYYWNIKSRGFSYNGAASSGSLSAIIDSGTTLHTLTYLFWSPKIYIPTAAAKKLYASIPGAKDASSTVGDGPSAAPSTRSTPPTSTSAPSPRDDAGGSLAIIGDEFMKNWYSVFNYSTKSVGFAKAI
ncbi:hypothetical protein FRC01_011718 [Tulasnella sp. 417]|nr:hypothetical protein FRC01_011718 [Tulasnella sp. 417]